MARQANASFLSKWLMYVEVRRGQDSATAACFWEEWRQSVSRGAASTSHIESKFEVWGCSWIVIWKDHDLFLMCPSGDFPWSSHWKGKHRHQNNGGSLWMSVEQGAARNTGDDSTGTIHRCRSMKPSPQVMRSPALSPSTSPHPPLIIITSITSITSHDDNRHHHLLFRDLLFPATIISTAIVMAMVIAAVIVAISTITLSTPPPAASRSASAINSMPSTSLSWSSSSSSSPSSWSCLHILETVSGVFCWPSLKQSMLLQELPRTADLERWSLLCTPPWFHHYQVLFVLCCPALNLESWMGPRPKWRLLGRKAPQSSNDQIDQ